jgi:hypothetical protein
MERRPHMIGAVVGDVIVSVHEGRGPVPCDFPLFRGALAVHRRLRPRFPTRLFSVPTWFSTASI